MYNSFKQEGDLKNSLSSHRRNIQTLLVSISILLPIFSHAFSKPTSQVEKNIVFLIPGTFSSAVFGAIQRNEFQTKITPYFGKNIIDTIQSQGRDVFVVKDLWPAGNRQRNNDHTAQFIKETYEKHYSQTKPTITLLGHSVGGLHALYAAMKLTHLPIKKVILISTPLEGSHLAETIFADTVLGRTFRTIANSSYPSFLELRGLPQATAKSIKKFIKTLKIPSQVRILAVAGFQRRPRHHIQIPYMNYLSPPMNFAASFYQGDTDGLVSMKSSYGLNTKIHTLSGSELQIEQVRSINLPLDHMEQVLEPQFFRLLGTVGINEIKLRQRRFYQEIFNYQ